MGEMNLLACASAGDGAGGSESAGIVRDAGLFCLI